MKLEEAEAKLHEASHTLDVIRGCILDIITDSYALGELAPQLRYDEPVKMLDPLVKLLGRDLYQMASELRKKVHALREGSTLLKDRTVPCATVEVVVDDWHTKHAAPTVAVVDGEVKYPIGLAVEELPKNKDV